ncbi:MAG: alpha/beta hydrolase fold domain-containing protein [Anaerolineales bacterium]|nr:alpha/beta hydrolase fold domain-containing protein [Anaerolineales bacterium]
MNTIPRPAGGCTGYYRWLLQTGVEPERLAVIGDSAGRNLTLALMLAIREAALPFPP